MTSRGGGAPAGAQFCWQNCWPNCWQKQSLNLQADEIPRRPKGLRRNDKRWRGCEDTRMVRPLNTNKSSPRSRGGGSPICWPNCWQKPPLNLQTDEIPRRPKGSVGMTSRGGGARTRGWFGHSTRTSHPPAPAAAGAQFVGRIVGRIVGRSNPFTYKRMRFLVARRALSE
jgi:hypothetical protein